MLTLERHDSPAGRTYLTPLGPLPSVTTILDKTRSPQATARMRAATARKGRAAARASGARTLIDAGDRLRSRAAARGTDVHARIEAALSDPWWDPASVGEEQGEDGWWHSAVPVLRRLEPEMVEAPVFSKHGFAGTLDLLARVDSRLVLVDWKTASSPKLREWTGDYEMQAAAYRVGLQETYAAFCQQAWIVVLYEDRPADVFELDADGLDAAWMRFQVRLATYQSKRSTLVLDDDACVIRPRRG